MQTNVVVMRRTRREMIRRKWMESSRRRKKLVILKHSRTLVLEAMRRSAIMVLLPHLSSRLSCPLLRMPLLLANQARS